MNSFVALIFFKDIMMYIYDDWGFVKKGRGLITALNWVLFYGFYVILSKLLIHNKY